MKTNWISTKEKLPENSTFCVVLDFDNKMQILYFNVEEMVWDDAEGDDYFCDIDEIKYYIEIPERI